MTSCVAISLWYSIWPHTLLFLGCLRWHHMLLYSQGAQDTFVSRQFSQAVQYGGIRRYFLRYSRWLPALLISQDVQDDMISCCFRQNVQYDFIRCCFLRVFKLTSCVAWFSGCSRWLRDSCCLPGPTSWGVQSCVQGPLRPRYPHAHG